MLEKDEVSKYTVPKNALDMLEWPPNGQTYTAKDIPQLIKKGFKPMTDSNIQPPANTTGETLADGTVGWPTETPPETNYPTPEEVAEQYLQEQKVDAEQKAYAEATANSTGYPQPGDTPYNSPDSTTVPNPVPGTEVTQSPGLIPETSTQIPGYDPNTSTAPGEYDPNSANVDTAVSTDPLPVIPHTPPTSGDNAEWASGTSVPPTTAEEYVAGLDYDPNGPPETHEIGTELNEQYMDPAYEHAFPPSEAADADAEAKAEETDLDQIMYRFDMARIEFKQVKDMLKDVLTKLDQLHNQDTTS